MDNRSQQIKNILPIIVSDNEKSSENEIFQNKTLRPILKFQNEICILYF